MTSFDDDSDEPTMMVPAFSTESFFAERYHIEETLGTGAMGKVYACTDVHTGDRVAVKVLHQERLGEEETLERFRREAEILAAIGHPCIVEVLAFHRAADGTPYLAMELLEGVTLKQRLAEGRFEDPRALQPILDGVCGALSAAHARGVVHRDMKPENVFLPRSGEPPVKLVDFGLSRLAANKQITRAGSILGTPRYMAPEQIRSAAEAEPKVDVYAVGVILYEALTGESPYPAQDYGQLLGCVMSGRVVPFGERRPELSRLAPVVEGAMAHEPQNRIESIDALADAFGQAIGSPSQRGRYTRATPTPSHRPRRASAASLVSSQSTLALDLSESGPRLAAMHAAAMGESPAPSTSLPGPATGLSPAQRAAQFAEVEPTEVLPEGERPSPAVAAPTAAAADEPPVRGGDTLYIAATAQAPLAPPGAVPPPPSPDAPAAWREPSRPTPAPVPTAPPTKRRGRGLGLILFFVALVVVIIVSAIGGFALRAYTRGQLELPSWAAPDR